MALIEGRRTQPIPELGPIPEAEPDVPYSIDDIMATMDAFWIGTGLRGCWTG